VISIGASAASSLRAFITDRQPGTYADIQGKIAFMLLL
jgi:hypothetical protein